jgi:hypothetical protein
LIRRIVKHVSEMTATVFAYNFGTHHAMTRVIEEKYSLRVCNVIKCRPSAVTFELILTFKQYSVARTAGIDALFLSIEVFAGIGCLCSSVSEYSRLFGGE